MKTLNDILGLDLKIYQDSQFFCFSIDSVILASLSHINLRCKNICDLGTGNGVIPLIISKRFNGSIVGVELQKDLAIMAKDSVSINNISNISIVNSDMRDYSKKNTDKFDLVLSNPPYFKYDSNSTLNKDVHKSIARHEIDSSLNDFFKCASLILKEGGRFATVNRCDNLIYVIDTLRNNNLEPKYLRFVYDKIGILPNLFIIESIKGGKEGLIVDKPFIMHNNDGSNTKEYDKLIRGDFDDTK